jgi:hypothetical protein
MARGALDKIENEGDFARGMGIAIAMLIALFAVGIALFVIQQGTAHSAAQVKDAARSADASAVPREPTPGATPPSASQ